MKGSDDSMGPLRAILAEDICAGCAHLQRQPGSPEMAGCTKAVSLPSQGWTVWPAVFDQDGYAVSCRAFDPREEGGE